MAAKVGGSVRQAGLSGRIVREWPTFALLVGVYGGLAALTYHFHDLSWYVVLVAGAYLTALHSSLQHEALHGHPTANRLLNEALVFVPFGLAYPYRRYRALHLRHHNDETLTDPFEDPESYYRSERDWAALPGMLKPLFRFNNTLLGRLTLGPALTSTVFLTSEIRALIRGDRDVRVPWLLHLAGIAILAAWVVGVCGMTMFEYVVFFAYPGMSLVLLRSFAEHQASEHVGNRTTVVEASPVFGLLFLNNNLHFAHHRYPALAWYLLPGVYRREREDMLRANGGYRFGGYGEIARRYLVRAKEPVVHPHAGRRS